MKTKRKSAMVMMVMFVISKFSPLVSPSSLLHDGPEIEKEIELNNN